jgi:hypothetical protein
VEVPLCVPTSYQEWKVRSSFRYGWFGDFSLFKSVNSVKRKANCGCWIGTVLQAGTSWVQILMRSLNFFNLHNASSSTMALGFTRPLTEMNSKLRIVDKADNLTSICEPIVKKMWDPQYFTALLKFRTNIKISDLLLLSLQWICERCKSSTEN